MIPDPGLKLGGGCPPTLGPTETVTLGVLNNSSPSALLTKITGFVADSLLFLVYRMTISWSSANPPWSTIIVPTAPDTSQSLTFAVSLHPPRRTRHHLPATPSNFIPRSASCALVTSLVPNGSSRDAGQAKSLAVGAVKEAFEGGAPAAATDAVMLAGRRPTTPGSAMSSSHSFCKETKCDIVGDLNALGMPPMMTLTPAGHALPGTQAHSGCKVYCERSTRASYTNGPRGGTTSSTSGHDIGTRWISLSARSSP
mmetsp:Transcript_115352/g.333224  ORF Transcript_115352/g.333224 Transcript_115352/m.333224 type:complete len:255 (-) Transcript_115352:327-1091(-)